MDAHTAAGGRMNKLDLFGIICFAMFVFGVIAYMVLDIVCG